MEIIEITPDNFRQICRMQVRADQQEFLSSVPMILSRAWTYRNMGSEVIVFLENGQPCALLMSRLADRGSTRVLDQFFVDQSFQGRGLGTQALREWLARLRQNSEIERVCLCCYRQNKTAWHFYKHMGFAENGLADGEEIILELKLSKDMESKD